MVSCSNEFHSMDKNAMEANGTRSYLVTNILQNIIFCVPQNKVSHTGLEITWGWENDADFSLLGGLSL